jgi:hypothetical protein
VFPSIRRILRDKKRRRRELIPAITFLSKEEKHTSLRSESDYNLETTWETFPLVSMINGLHGKL